MLSMKLIFFLNVAHDKSSNEHDQESIDNNENESEAYTEGDDNAAGDDNDAGEEDGASEEDDEVIVDI